MNEQSDFESERTFGKIARPNTELNLYPKDEEIQYNKKIKLTHALKPEDRDVAPLEAAIARK